jgi:hypothetical protein
MKKLSILFVLLLFLVIPLETSAKNNTDDKILQKTQLEKRQIQTKTYKTNDKALIMKAMLNVLQDEGFIINNANPLLGFISAIKEFDSRDKSIDTEKEFGISKNKLSWSGVNMAVIDATANVTEYGPEIRVRVNFKRKMLNVYGSAISVTEIDSQDYYENFFSKVDKAIFIQKNKI